ncbi:MAG: polyphenol oxidase family protein [Candidatus Peribacteraceae bacterium]|jgi:hypothetical protein
MPSQPFRIFDQFSNRLTIAFFDKKDGAHTDESVREKMNARIVVALDQVHGGTAVITRERIRRDVQADAVATDASHLALTIRVADCQSFLIYAPEQHVVALAHAGWKGLLAGILPATFDLLREEWNIRPEDTYVAAGPSLCRECAEFTDPRKELPGIDRRFFSGRNVDLRAIAEDQLWKLGVREERFERQPDCTACGSGTYWSYRGGDRDAVRKGSTNLLACSLRPLVR